MAKKKTFFGIDFDLDRQAFSLSFRRLVAIGAGALFAMGVIFAANLLPGELYFGGVTLGDYVLLMVLFGAMLATWWAMQGDQRRRDAGTNVEVTTSTSFDLIITGVVVVVLSLLFGARSATASWHFFLTFSAAFFAFWLVCHRIWKGA